MSYREERRADQAAARAQDREDRRLELDARLKATEIQAEQRRKDAEAKRRLEQADKKAREQERERKKAARATRMRGVAGWLKANPATVFVGFVMVASIVPALISQVTALSEADVPVVLAALLAAMLEGGAWAITFMGKQADDAGRATRKYRIGTWVIAALAAAIQFWHWSAVAPLWVAFVFGGSSLFAIYIWDLKTHGSGSKTQEERKEAKARREHLDNRRRHHKDIAKEADRLLSALPYGSVTEEEAFAAAWRIHRGAEPGLSAELYATATNARVQLGAAFELGEHVRPELLRTGMLAAVLNPLTELPATRLPVLGATSPVTAAQTEAQDATVTPLRPAKQQRATQVPPAGKKARTEPSNKPVPPRRRKGDTPAFHPAARAAAAETARRQITVTAHTD
ncbi:hypothetical protein ABZ770_33805 [Streptomyces sp. NPDC006654]|uniref:hypothetical protein n=1 Tax=Streptomyces sp. NPDC006654 TaxID=3156897 RepID=UPI0033C246F9